MKKLLLLLCSVLILSACSGGSDAVEILVTTTPANADIYWQNALLGTTPMKLTVKQPMELLLTAEGFEPAKSTVYTNSTTPLVIPLTAVAAPAPKPKSAASVKKQGYANLRAIKAAYRSGRMTKSEYRRLVTRYKEKMGQELARAKTQYRNGELTRSQYKRRVNNIKERYK